MEMSLAQIPESFDEFAKMVKDHEGIHEVDSFSWPWSSEVDAVMVGLGISTEEARFEAAGKELELDVYSQLSLCQLHQICVSIFQQQNSEESQLQLSRVSRESQICSGNIE